MARLHDEEPGETVEVAPPLVVPDVGTLAAHDHGHVALPGLVDAVAREVHPQVALRGSSPAVLAGFGHELRCHGHRVPQV